MSEELEEQYGIIDFEDEQDRGTDLLPEIFKNSENIKKVVNIFMQMIQELHDAGKDVYSKINIFEAEGSQLDDIFGTMLNTPRKLGETDDEYRNVLLTSTLKLSRSGDIITVKNAYRTLTEATSISLVEYQPHTIILNAQVPDPSQIETAYIQQEMEQVKMGGVEMALSISIDTNPFSFISLGDAPNPLFGFSDLASPSPSVGGYFSSLVPDTDQNVPLCEIDSSSGQVLRIGVGTLAFTGPANRTYIEAQTGLLKTVGANVFRNEQDGGLRTGITKNLLLQSENLDTTWLQAGDVAVPVQDGTLSSEGTKQMWKLTSTDFSIAANALYLNVAIIDTGQDISVSIDFRPGTSSVARIRTIITGGTSQDDSSRFDMATETWVSQDPQHKNFKYEKLFDGSYRISLTVAVNNTGQTNFAFRISANDSTTIYATFGQVEELPFATPYIATTTLAVELAAESTLLPTVGNVPDLNSDFTVAWDMKPIGSHNGVPSSVYLWQLASNTNGFTSRLWNGGDVMLMYWNGVNVVSSIFPGLSLLDYNKLAITRSGNNLTGYINGIVAGSIVISNIVGLTYDSNIGIGNSTSGSLAAYFHQNYFKMWKYALTDPEIAAL